MLDSTLSGRPQQYLRSPFNGEAWAVPPDVSPEFVAELEKRGFTRIAPGAKSKAKKESAHDD